MRLRGGVERAASGIEGRGRPEADPRRAPPRDANMSEREMAMRQWKRGMVAIATVTLLATSVGAMDNDPSVAPHDRHPGVAISAALLNVLYMPLRIVTTFIGAEFAGIVGLLTGGNVHAADDTFDLVNGSQVITPKMLEGKEAFHVSAYD
jgi:hypothetical protein